MEEVYTCECRKQNHWTIYSNKIECSFCGTVYILNSYIEPREFNKIRLGKITVKEA